MMKNFFNLVIKCINVYFCKSLYIDDPYFYKYVMIMVF
jgi:hypothetical protein